MNQFFSWLRVVLSKRSEQIQRQVPKRPRRRRLGEGVERFEDRSMLNGCGVVATDDSYTVLHDGYLAGYYQSNLLYNDTFPTGDETQGNAEVTSITVDGTTAALAGSGATITTNSGELTVYPDGDFIFVPAAGFVGSMAFDYTLTNNICSDTASSAIDVTNTPPVAVENEYLFGPGSNGESFSVQNKNEGLLGNDIDPDYDSGSLVYDYDRLIVTEIVADGISWAIATTGTTVSTAGGQLAMQPDGTFTFTPFSSTAQQIFSYSMTDGVNTSSALVALYILAAPDHAPYAVDDTFSVPQVGPAEVTFSIDEILFNDGDFEGDVVSLESIGSTFAGGAITDNLDGTFTYLAPSGWDGMDYADYVISDGTASARLEFVWWEEPAEMPDFPIDIKIAAFIPLSKGIAVTWDVDPGDPCSSLRWAPEPTLFPAGPPWYFATDNREKAGDPGTSRLFSEGAFMASEIGNLEARTADIFSTDVGDSHRVKTIMAGGETKAYKHTIQTEPGDWGDSEDRKDGTGNLSNTSFVTIEANGAYAFSSIAPDINYFIWFAFERDNDGTADVSVRGWHDAFPAYEIIINGTEVVYKKYPTDPGPTMSNLGGHQTAYVYGSATLTAPD